MALFRLAPSNLVQLRHYQRSWLRGDVLAGITVAAYLVPQVMAYAQIAGLPAVAGLWAMLPCMLAYAVFGSSRQLSIGPEATTALLTASIIGPLAGGDPARYAELAAELALVYGAFCVMAWFARLGFIADLISRPVLIGYMAGVAVIMSLGQLGKVTGAPVTGSTLWAEAFSFAHHIREVQPDAVVVAAVTLVLLVWLHRRWPVAPGALLAVAAVTAVVALAHLDQHGVALIGHVTGGLPRPSLPGVAHVSDLLLPALGLSTVGYADSIITARSFAARRGYEIDANQEWLALGACNLGSAASHGFPVSSSASRGALGDATGSRSQLFSLVALVSVVLTLAFLRPLLAHFPAAALGGLVMYAAGRLVDVHEFRRLARFRRRELLLALVATLGVLTFNILYGVLIAVGVSVADLLMRVARPHAAVLGSVPGLAGMHSIADYPQAAQEVGLLVFRYDSPLFFANAEDFRHRALAAVADEPGGVVWFVLNAEAMIEVDITGLDALEAVRSALVAQGIVVGMARVKQSLLTDLTSYGLTASIGPGRIFPTLPTMLAAYRAWLGEHTGGQLA